jgi:hypothetical protein
VCGARTATGAGRRESVNSAAMAACRAGRETADGHGSVEGQPLGIPGISQGAPLSQGPSSEDDGDAVVSPMEAEATDADDCMPCISLAPLMSMAKPLPATDRWRRNSPARSTAKKREWIMVYKYNR